MKTLKACLVLGIALLASAPRSASAIDLDEVKPEVIRILKQRGILDVNGSLTVVATTRTVSTTSPLTGGGDLSANRTIAFSNQTANTVLAGGTSGGASAPAFRALVAADIPGTLASLTLSSGLTLTGATVTGAPTWGSSQAITLSTAAQPNVTSLGTLTGLTMGGTLTVGANTLSLASSTVSGTPTWSSSQAITLSTAAQPNVTSLGTLTSLATGSITMTDATNIVVGSTTGTKIGTATSQKLGFFNATPVVQITGSTDILASLVTLGFRAASSNPPLNMGTGTLTCGAINAGGTVTVGANTLALASTTVSGTPTWSSSQAITLSTASQPNVTGLGTIATGTWQATKIAEAYGGTNQTTYTTGDLLYASASNTLSKLSAGTATYVLTANGAGVAPSWQAAAGGGGGVAVQDRDVTAQSVTNTTTETAVYSYSVPGNTLGSTKRLRGHANTHIAATAGGSITLRVKWGSSSVTVASGAFTTAGDAYRIDFEVTALNATGSQDLSATCASTTAFNGLTARTTASEDSTAAKTIQITLEWSAADAGNQFTCDTVILELE